jgi:hypothetical protein
VHHGLAAGRAKLKGKTGARLHERKRGSNYD